MGNRDEEGTGFFAETSSASASFNPRGNVLLEICTPDIRISRISAGYQRPINRISREN